MTFLISLRYGKGAVLGALTTVGVLLAVVPYIGLQLKSVSDTFNLLSYREVVSSYSSPLFQDTALYVALVLAVFGILFGARHLDPSERHEGIVAGPGLGLPIVHRIISQHHGEIAIDSQVNVGTTVTIRLPVTMPRVPDTEPARV